MDDSYLLTGIGSALMIGFLFLVKGKRMEGFWFWTFCPLLFAVAFFAVFGLAVFGYVLVVH